ncbi:MAG: phosphorylase family protein [Gammaproteobacteria bacterium]|nr:phosphorylase family protein [Gammaproteobacteria bacterium]
MNQIGIIAALQPEAACLTREVIALETLIRLDTNLSLYVCGMGAERATNGARIMVQAGMDVLVSWGTAGAIATHLHAGDLCMPEAILGFDDRVYQTAKHWRNSVVNKLVDCPCDIYLGQMADAMRVLTTAEEKTGITERNKSVIAVDMESAAIAEVACASEKPYIVIRVISDTAGMVIPDIAIKITDPFGRVRLARLLHQTLTNPLQIPGLIKLALGYRKAAITMRWIGERLPNVFS